MPHNKKNLLELCFNRYISIKLLNRKIQISHLFRARQNLDIQATRECRFTLKRVRDMIITYSYSSLVL